MGRYRLVETSRALLPHPEVRKRKRRLAEGRCAMCGRPREHGLPFRCMRCLAIHRKGMKRRRGKRGVGWRVRGPGRPPAELIPTLVIDRMAAILETFRKCACLSPAQRKALTELLQAFLEVAAGLKEVPIVRDLDTPPSWK